MPITSESVSSDGISASSSPTGSTTSVPSACGTRTASPWPPSTPSTPHQPPWRHGGLQPLPAEDAGAVGADERRDDEVAGLDGADVGADGLDDADELVSHAAAGRRSCSIDLYGQRSLPQMPARVTRTSASVGSIEAGVGDVLDANVAGAVHDGCAHAAGPFGTADGCTLKQRPAA